MGKRFTEESAVHMAGPNNKQNQPCCRDQDSGIFQHDEAVVKPVKGKRSLSVESPVVLVGTSGDLNTLIRMMPLKSVHPQPLFNSRLYANAHDPLSAAFIGPIVGAPYAAMVMETLIVWGARQFIFLGWCGALSPELKIGDLVIPTAAIIDEGTSPHYPCDSLPSKVSHPTAIALDRIRQQAARGKIPFREGAVWTTDAIFRETPEKIRHFLTQGALAVDMETSALFTVAKYREVDIGGILVVSDDLSSLNWVPGFKTEAFSSARVQACEVIRRICLSLSTPKSSRESPN